MPAWKQLRRQVGARTLQHGNKQLSEKYKFAHRVVRSPGCEPKRVQVHIFLIFSKTFSWLYAEEVQSCPSPNPNGFRTFTATRRLILPSFRKVAPGKGFGPQFNRSEANYAITRLFSARYFWHMTFPSKLRFSFSVYR
jgi:hypothetical protein